MKIRPLILLAGAVCLAAATALVARALMKPPPPVTIIKEVEAPRPPVQKVLAASRLLTPGEFIDGPSLSWQDLTADVLRADMLTAAAEVDRRKIERDLYGATLRRPLAAGQVLTRDLLLYTGDPGFLAAVLRPGMRAISIPTTTVASNAGLVNAGDRVDVILNLNRGDLEKSSSLPNSTYGQLASQTVVHDVRVLAINSSAAGLVPASTPDAGEAQTSDAPRRAATARASGGAARVVYESVTLEVSPTQAQQLVLAREMGTLQIALRSVNGDPAGTEIPTGVTHARDATRIFDDLPRLESVTAFRGTEQKEQVFGAPPSTGSAP